jgi:NAD(P)-dependent dehydrogenase (short-subunit alcohol dehydrogenase family)
MAVPADVKGVARPMDGRVCMVTGATAGIGMAAAAALAGLGATVVAVGRNPEKGSRLVERLKREAGNPAVEFLCADLSLQAEVRDLAAEFTRRHARLHVLVNNVGGFFLQRKLTRDGFEATFALNHLNVFLLTHLLLDTLRSSAPARIVNVSSDAHRRARPDFAGIDQGRGAGGMRAYGQSKLAMTLFTYELARRLQGSGVTVNAVHPGFVASSMYDNSGGLVRLAAPLIKRMGKSTEEGADSVVYLAASPEVEGVTGKYFTDRKAVPSSPASYDEDAARRLWEMSARMVGVASLDAA